MEKIIGISSKNLIFDAANSPGCDIIGENGEVIWAEQLIHPDKEIANKISKAAFKSVFRDKLNPYSIARIDEIPYCSISLPGTVILMDTRRQYGNIFD